jgi:hypothetical protein
VIVHRKTGEAVTMDDDCEKGIAELRQRIGAVEKRVNELNEIVVDLVKNLRPEIEKMGKLVGVNAMNVAQLGEAIEALKGEIPSPHNPQ